MKYFVLFTIFKVILDRRWRPVLEQDPPGRTGDEPHAAATPALRHGGSPAQRSPRTSHRSTLRSSTPVLPVRFCLSLPPNTERAAGAERCCVPSPSREPVPAAVAVAAPPQKARGSPATLQRRRPPFPPPCCRAAGLPPRPGRLRLPPAPRAPRTAGFGARCRLRGQGDRRATPATPSTLVLASSHSYSLLHPPTHPVTLLPRARPWLPPLTPTRTRKETHTKKSLHWRYRIFITFPSTMNTLPCFGIILTLSPSQTF